MVNRRRCLLQINTVANLGSTGHIVEQIGAHAQECGWNSYVAYGREASESSSKLVRIGNKIDTYTHAISSMLFDKHGLMSRKATADFINEIEKINPDIIHIHNLHGYYINYPQLFDYIKHKDIPTVITLHDFWLMTGHCAYINDSCTKWKTGCDKCQRLNSYPSSFTDHSYRNWRIKSDIFSDVRNITVVPVSYWMRSKLESSILKNVPCEVIHNGIDTNKFFPDTNPSQLISNKFYNILCVATRWTESNGFDDIIQLSKLLDSYTRIIVVGVTAEQIKSLPKNVVGLERTESIEQLRALYSNTDIFLNPNKEVTFGLVTAEAMACGTPSIVFHDTAGEEIVNDETGYVINNISEVVSIIQKMKNVNSLQIRKSCRTRIMENFIVANQLDKYFNLYENMLNQ